MTANTSETPSKGEAARAKKKRTFWLTVVIFLFSLAGLGLLLYWIFIGRFYVFTDDAYVHGNEVMLTPQVSAGVKAIYADETDLVQQGQLIVELDRSDFELKFEELKQNLAATVREVSRMFQDVEAREAQVALRAAELRQAELDLKHREPLVKTGAVAVEVFETYQTNVLVAASSLVVAEKELAAAKSLVEGTTVQTHPLVKEASWNLRQAYLDLIRCQVWSPVTGYLAKRTVQVGDRVKKGDTLLYIVPLNEIWIEANYKETQLKHLRIGQPVRFTADLYGKEIPFHGGVIGFQPGSGNAFSLLPPENASGNWIKIIQRVPVRISIEQEEILRHPLFLGLSIRATVDVHETDGSMLPKSATMEPLYSTPIYTRQMEEMIEIDPLIEDVIRNNSYPSSS
jgi:membrane fusion protein, multidrug efflux system